MAVCSLFRSERTCKLYSSFSWLVGWLFVFFFFGVFQQKCPPGNDHIVLDPWIADEYQRNINNHWSDGPNMRIQPWRSTSLKWACLWLLFLVLQWQKVTQKATNKAPCWADKLPTSSPSVVPTPVGSWTWFPVMKVVSTPQTLGGSIIHQVLLGTPAYLKETHPQPDSNKNHQTSTPAHSDLRLDSPED